MLGFYRDWLIFPTWVLVAGLCWLWPHTIGNVVGIAIIGACILAGGLLTIAALCGADFSIGGIDH